MEQGSQWEKAYTHGGDVYRNEKIRMDFSININPLGMPDFIKQAAMDGVEESARYPDSRCRRLRRLAAGFYGVQEETLVFGNGAAGLISRDRSGRISQAGCFDGSVVYRV